MKKILLLGILIFLFQSSKSQDYNFFSTELRNLKHQYKNCLYSEKIVDELEDKIEQINWKVYDLEEDIEQYIEKENLNKNNKFIDIQNEIKEFYAFTSGQPTCNCLHFFNKFLSEIGGSTTLLKHKEAIKVFMAKIGNFKFYYAYSLNNWAYTVTINMKKNMGSSKFIIGLGGEIEVFNIIEVNENWSVSNLTAIIRSKGNEFRTVKCENEFPRY
jgi:hypothetical protein